MKSAKQRLFIYDRREVLALGLLTTLVTAFAFTLGIHLGKQVAQKSASHQQETTATVDTMPDKTPSKEEIAEQGKDTPTVSAKQVQDLLTVTLKDEVHRTGIKLDAPRQVDLPKETKAEIKKLEAEIHSKESQARKEGGGPDEPGESEAPAEKPRPAEPLGQKSAEHAVRAEPAKPLQFDSIPAAKRTAPEGMFTLQIGSFPTLEEANELVQTLEAHGLLPFLRTADLKHKGRWYRVFMGGYDNKDIAQQAGQRLVAERKIQNFMAAKLEH